jgi:hypothetical protein
MAKESYLRCDFSISVAALQEPLHKALHLAVGANRLLQNKFKSMLTVHKGKFRYIHIAQESIHKFVHIQIRAENFTHHGNMSHNNFDINAQKLMVYVCVCVRTHVCLWAALVTTSSAPKVDILVEYSELAEAYFKIAPNSKLPPKAHSASLLAEHQEHGPIFSSANTARSDASIWAAHIRTVLVKYRDLAAHPPKLAIIERQATLQCVAIMQVVMCM